jgi:hypothetical protein
VAVGRHFSAVFAFGGCGGFGRCGRLLHHEIGAGTTADQHHGQRGRNDDDELLLAFGRGGDWGFGGRGCGGHGGSLQCFSGRVLRGSSHRPFESHC